MAANPKQDDSVVFKMLELRDKGFTLGRIARMLRLSRGIVSGCLHRVDHAVDPERLQEGTMPYGWWREGLEKR